ncbi:pyruvate kinase [Lacrimispora sp. NSJ-141]|uniref:Pyruvate kinase n=1 Tax=Lientehia hominis TaxID=2897778 RepID=A0AAP2RIK0_9FIRM|nr:pyruvate kinase [Lientehia hominis]MCD2492018.1 pyruvate kinase [Lientehia hominis]
MRKTKIICTMGPAVDTDEAIRSLISNGMDCARFNFSHGSHEEQKTRMDRVKRVSAELGRPVALLLDTKGPEIRLQNFEEGSVVLQPGQAFTLSTSDEPGTEEGVGLTFCGLASCVSIGTRILIDDGKIAMFVEKIDGTSVICRVINGGKISNHKSINIPNLDIPMPYINEADRSDILFGISQDVDFVAASFTRTADDIRKLRKLLDDNGGKRIQIIAKIENTQGIENLDEILTLSDGVMVARGDLGVEIPFRELPGIQKTIIKKCYRAGKHVVTATQMLESMTYSPRPTRAEVSDVANAIYDGTSVIMLSGETAAGDYPTEAVRTMADIAEATEKDINYKKRFSELHDSLCLERIPAVAVGISAITSANYLDAKAIVAVTRTGRSARMIADYRPAAPIIAPTVDKKALRQLSLAWGVYPFQAEEQSSADSLFRHAEDIALRSGIVEEGDTIVISGGPHEKNSAIDMMRISKL